MEDKLRYAVAFSGIAGTDDTLTGLVEAADKSLQLRLRQGVTPEDCGKAYPMTVGALAAAAYEKSLERDHVTDFTAGEVKISLEPPKGSFAEAMLKLLRPWLQDEGFAFRSVGL